MSKKALVLLALAVVACKPDSDAKQKPATASLTDLTTSLDAVRTEFNAHKGEARFLTLLSPT
jgi:hypothetical protein